MASSAVAVASSTLAVASSSSFSPLFPRTHHHSLHLHQLPWRPSLPSFYSSPSPPPRFLLLPRSLSDDSLNNSPPSPSPEPPLASPVAVIDEQPPPRSPSRPKRPSALERGGTLTGDKALGKDPGAAVMGKRPQAVISGKFQDPRWKNGTWDLAMFTADGKVNWDGVIDAEVVRRKWLEENPEASLNDDPVVFETSTIPWWAWMKRFHLPEAELLNGRAAMLGFFFGYVIDSLTGVGLVDQTSSLFGKIFLLITVLGVLVIRKNEDVDNLRQLIKESTFYDKQWQASWSDEQPPSSKKEE